MKRQTLDGKPIYNDKLWAKMVETGNILINLGYKEASKKPNLFYKKIYKDNDEYEIVFADLRGTEYEPIWKRLRLHVYRNFDYDKGYSCNDIDFGFQVIFLKRHISIPLDYSFYFKYDEDDDLNGFCRKCNKDIVLNKELNKSQYSEELDPDIELVYCDECKAQKYAKRRKAKLCFHCKKRDWEINHHIAYHPELTIKVCPTCHSKIHNSGFPNLLWKQKKEDFENEKRKRREKKRRKNMKLYACKKCEIEVFSPNKIARCPYCKKKMDEMQISNFHCKKCSKSWSGIFFQEICPNCMIKAENKINVKDKMLLGINICSIKVLKLKEELLNLYKRKF